jgi:hypothetical protein
VSGVAHVEPENVNSFVDQASQRFRLVRRRPSVQMSFVFLIEDDLTNTGARLSPTREFDCAV